VPPPEQGVDPELDRVTDWFRARGNLEQAFGVSIRTALDEVIDTPRTGRWSFEQCQKPEMTYMGYKLEHVIRRQFDLGPVRPRKMDYRIDGIDVDCKWSKTFGHWEIPLEAVGHICLVVWGRDTTREFAVGLIRIREEILVGGNQDKKRKLQSPGGRGEIRWLIPPKPSLPENFLDSLPDVDRDAILGHRGGDDRLMELFTRCVGVILKRHTIESVGQQKDAARRARAARPRLLPLGFELLNGHWEDHRRRAKELGGPIPRDSDEWVCLCSDGSTPQRVLERPDSNLGE
jgi:hypothetical protein